MGTVVNCSEEECRVLEFRVLLLCCLEVNLCRQLCLDVSTSCPRECIRSLVCVSTHMTNISRKLGYVTSKVTSLPRGILVCVGGESKVHVSGLRQYVELTAFNEVAKVVNGQIDHEEFTVECIVSWLCGSKCLGEKCNQLPSISNLLLEDSSNCTIRGVCHNVAKRVALARTS